MIRSRKYLKKDLFTVVFTIAASLLPAYEFRSDTWSSSNHLCNYESTSIWTRSQPVANTKDKEEKGLGDDQTL